MSYKQFAVFMLVLTLAAGSVSAERKYSADFTANFLGGIGNLAGNSSIAYSGFGMGNSPFFSASPSLFLRSIGERSELNMNYAFVLDRYQMDPDPLTTYSHAFDVNWTSKLGKSARFTLGDTYSDVPNLSALNVIKGFTFTSLSQGFQYIFEPMLLKNSSRSNSAKADLEVDLTQRSYLTFGVASAIRRYQRDEVGDSPFFQNQDRLEGHFAYSYKANKRNTLGAEYRMYQNDYRDFGMVRAHTALFTYSVEVSSSFKLDMEAGPAMTMKNPYQDETRYGYNAAINLSEKLKSNLFTLHYRRRAGDSTGLGYVTDSHEAGVGFSRTIGRSVSVNADISAFRQRNDGMAEFDYEGLSATAEITRMLGKHWMIGLGGSYQDYRGDMSTFRGLDRKRAYISISFLLPEFWRAVR